MAKKKLLSPKRLFQTFKQAASEWSKDSASSRAAALSYYSALSISPLLVIAISIAGLVFGPDQVRTEVIGQIEGLVGSSGAGVIDSMLRSTHSKSGSITATVIGVATLLLGAGGVFIELQDALNNFWGAHPQQGSGILHFIKTRVLSFAMVLGIGFLLLVSLLLSTAIDAFGAFVMGRWPALQVAAHAINILLSLAIITVLFALIYKILPNVKLKWHDVWTGAFVTALLFSIGKFLIGFYLGRASTASPYGAAGSVIVILLWLYYSAQIVYLGAEFTKVHARLHGSHREQTENNSVATSSPEKRSESSYHPGEPHPSH